MIIDFSSTPIRVNSTPDDYYDLVFFESEYNGNSGYIRLDYIIIGIIKDINTSSDYYEVFNWGNNDPDTNTNANIDELPTDPPCPSGEECDNYGISTTDLYSDSGVNTGIVIDVDTAPAAPPPGDYNQVIIISPSQPAGSGDSAQVDAIVVTEIPKPTPTPTP